MGKDDVLVPKPDAGDTIASLRWVPAAENPFGVELLDCREFAGGTEAWTRDQTLVASFDSLRRSAGEELREQSATPRLRTACRLVYPVKDEPEEGPFFMAQVMEEKWDIFLYGERLYLTRSWTGELVYAAALRFASASLEVLAVEDFGEPREEGPTAVAVVDFLIRSHLARLTTPYPLPTHLGRSELSLALYGFHNYGRFGRLGTFADTLRLPLMSWPLAPAAPPG